MPLQWTPRKGTWLPGALLEYEEERGDLTIGTENGLSPLEATSCATGRET